MKIAFKNFLTMLRRYRTASVLNIAGLTLALTSCYVIASQVIYNLTYNRAIPDADRILLVSPLWIGGSYSDLSPRPVTGQTARECPEVEAVGTMVPYGDTEHVWTKVNDYHFERFDVDESLLSPSMTALCSFRAVEGDLQTLAEPDHILLSQRLAERMGVHAGDAVYLPDPEGMTGEKPVRCVTVGAVFADFPRNTLFGRTELIEALGDDAYADNSNWGSASFIRLRAGADPRPFADRWMQNYEAWAHAERNTALLEHWDNGETEPGLHLLPLDELFYDRTIDDAVFEKGTVATTAVLIVLALVIFAVALINFVNFFFALIPVRLRAVNICKVFGASQTTLRTSFLFEAAGLVLLSLGCAAYLMLAVQESPVADFVTAPLALADNLRTLAAIGVAAVVMALTAAFYPAFYITRFNASLGVRAGFAGSRAGRRLRMLLAGAQFTVSIVLIALAAIFFLQYRYMIRFDAGFDRERIVTFSSSPEYARRWEAATDYLLQHPDVEGVTQSSRPMIGRSQSWGTKFNDREIFVTAYGVRHDFMEVIGVPLLDGEPLPPYAPGDGLSPALVNRCLQERTEAKTGDRLYTCTIAGVVEDLYVLPLRESLSPMAWYRDDPQQMTEFYLRLRAGADVAGVFDHIRASVEALSPGDDEPEIAFLNRRIEALYGSTRRETIIVALFALTAIVISLMGVFGIILFETQHRRREIAVRKVFGASTGSLIGMLDRQYAAILLGSGLAAAPVIAVIARRWLEQFAYRIAVGWWVYAAAFAAVALPVLLLVTLRSRRAAEEDPAKVMQNS